MKLKLVQFSYSVKSVIAISGIILFLFFVCSATSVAQINTSKFSSGVSPKKVVLTRKPAKQKNSSPVLLKENKMHFNLSPSALLQLKNQIMAPGTSGGVPIKDVSKFTLNKKAINKIQAPVSSTSFEGISQYMDDIPYYPPDPVVASSGSEIINAVNDEFNVFDTSGNLLYYDTFQQLYSLPSNTFITDPKVLYDPQHGRFIMLTLLIDWYNETSSYLLAVSSDSTDPGGSWYCYTINASYDGINPTSNFCDFPGLGYDSLSIFITSNQYDFNYETFQYAKLRVLNKNAIYNSAPSTYYDFWNMKNADNSQVFTLKPAKTIGSSNNEFLLNTDAGGNNYISTWKISYAAGVPSLNLGATLNIGSYQVPPDAQQLGSIALISTGDCRTQDVVWKNNEMYTAFTEGYNWGGGDVSAIRVLKINTNTWTVDRNIDYGSDNVYYYYPAVTPDNNDNMYLAFNTSSTEQYVDMRSAANIWNNPSSLFINQSYDAYKEPRWGDYNGIALSPTGTVWAVGEIGDGTQYWATWIAALSSPTGPTNSFMALSDSVVDFIGVRVGSSSLSRFDVQNTDMSSGNLTGAASIKGSHFILTKGSSFNAAPGQVIKFEIQYNNAAAGFVNDTLIVNNNSSNYPSVLKIPITAYGVVPAKNPKKIKFDFTDDYYEQSDTSYFSSFIKLLRAKGYMVVTDDPSFDLRGYDYFISVTPYQQYSPDQINTIQAFVKNGGGLIVLPYSGYYPGTLYQNSLLSADGWNTGITINNRLVVDTAQFFDNNVYWIKLFNLPHPNDPLVSSVDTLGAFYSASLSVASPADSIVLSSSSAFDFLNKLGANNGSYARVNEFSQRSSSGDIVQQTSASKNLPVVAQAKVGAGQVIVLGTEEMFAEPDYQPAYYIFPSYYYPGIRYKANRVFALNLFDTQTGPPVVKIVSVNDVPNDNGKQVKVTWKNEFASGPTPISGYAVWRFDSTWTFINQVPANGDSVYSIVVPTISDSNSSGAHYTLFRVSAYIDYNPVIFNSAPDSGYSVNNLKVTSVPAPAITSIKDVSNDQGHQVYLSWKLASSAVNSGISKFSVWRRDSVWVFVSDITATNDNSYSFIAPTVFDSTITNGMHYSVFKVSAHSSDPSIYAMSLSDSGYSKDNLSPFAPDSLNASISQNSVVVQWSRPVDKDFQYFEVFKDTVSNFIINDVKPIATVTSNQFIDSKIIAGKVYYYRIASVDFSGNLSDLSASASVAVTGVEKDNIIPGNYALIQNYPNPFNPSTSIEFDLPKAETVKLRVFDILGREVATLVNSYEEAGSHKVEWEGKDNSGNGLSSGIYFYTIEAGSFKAVKKMIYLK